VKVILTQDVPALGKSGELKDVSDGFARNFLIPQKKAVSAAGGAYRAWFDAHRCVAALVRPDFYVFGTAATADEVRSLVRGLEAALSSQATRQETLTT